MARTTMHGALVVLLASTASKATYPTIHVDWDESPPPVEDVNYFVDRSNPDFPNVELIDGSLTWRIWSTDPDNPDGIGDIGVISSPYPENFAVRILDDNDGPGARTVKGINLDPSDASNYSNLLEGDITGDFEGGLFLQKSSGGTGGALTGWFGITGDLEGHVTVPKIDGGSLYVSGNVAANVEIAVTDRLVNQGQLRILGHVPSTVVVKIDDMEDSSEVWLAEESIFEGGAVFANGIPDQTELVVATLASPGYVNLNNHNVDGFVLFLYGGDGDVLSGGIVTGVVNLAFSYAFSGTAEFAEVVGTSQDYAVVAAGNLDGTIRITTDVSAYGYLQTSDLGSSGSIVVDDDVVGHISAGSVAGDILVAGLLSGDIKVYTETAQYSLIRVTEGIASTGRIVVNDYAGNYNCNGNIHIGPLTGTTSITFDGSILIKDGPSGGGDLIGGITVRGCHATNDDLDICICGGDGYGNINIIQQTCQTRVRASCVSGCP